MKQAKSIEILARGVHVADGRLLVCRNRKAGILYLPGGHVEVGEGAGQALVREIREEMGRRARIRRFLGVSEQAFLQQGEPHVEINLVFEVAIQGVAPGRDPESEEDHIDFTWAPLARLARLPFKPVDLGRILPRWLKAIGQGSWQSNIP